MGANDIKNRYSHFIQPDNDQLKNLLKEATIIPDTNIILEIYRSSPKTQDDILEILEKVSDRLFFPDQVIQEYLSLRPQELLKETHVRKFVKNLREAKNKLKKIFESDNNDQVNVGIKKDLDEIIDLLVDKIKINEKKEPNSSEALRNDPILEKINELSRGHIGDPFSKERLDCIYKEGEERYKKKIPPGYEDQNKKEANTYGDLVIWEQIIEYAKFNKKDAIFITNDQKEDWWWRNDKETIGPRHELKKEFKDRSGQKIHFYRLNKFIEFSSKELSVKLDSETIEELEESTEENTEGSSNKMNYQFQDIKEIQKALKQLENQSVLLKNTLDFDKLNRNFQAMSSLESPSLASIVQQFQQLQQLATHPSLYDTYRNICKNINKKNKHVISGKDDIEDTGSTDDTDNEE
ncbi:hypothetical protein Dpep_0373 [Dethiosulfovibrio peptidovorans DSM 11002]|uniref:PIN like domain-containing protein n=1 Tax=Dethiosulfovibrio peptidovorans DSM 11002 TaxID=469381 RepID=D2Z3U9_9BACT|nr:PIN domain-containing protein [Dethiosulfovibrio peptidovorans]EFC90405.1 hypothetical protein Dpep_0373 [Dethiosulfovibrio peptidovorans DSM 11002]